MPRRAPNVVLADDVRAGLVRRGGARSSSQLATLRARIVELTADGLSNTAIAQTLGIARGTVRTWRARFVAAGLVRMADRPNCPPPRRYGREIQAGIALLARRSPAEVGRAGPSYWTIKGLATYIGEHPELGLGAPSKSTVHKVLPAHNVCLDRF